MNTPAGSQPGLPCRSGCSSRSSAIWPRQKDGSSSSSCRFACRFGLRIAPASFGPRTIFAASSYTRGANELPASQRSAVATGRRSGIRLAVRRGITAYYLRICGSDQHRRFAERARRRCANVRRRVRASYATKGSLNPRTGTSSAWRCPGQVQVACQKRMSRADYPAATLLARLARRKNANASPL